MVTPLSPGTAIDILARLYGERLSRRFGQQVIVPNFPGVGGLAPQAVGTAPADGYTLLLVNSADAIFGTSWSRRPSAPAP